MDQYRRTPRAGWIPYNEGEYFVTICCKDRRHFFGEIRNEAMVLSPIGEIVVQELSAPHIHHPHIEIPLFVVMPNHIQAIICVSTPDKIKDSLPECGDERRLSGYVEAIGEVPVSERTSALLSAYIGSFKSAVSREVHKISSEFAWQPRYHDRKIRDTGELNRISEYIENNVALWGKDCFNN